MKVIKHGNTYREIECPKCGALLSYCSADVNTWSEYGEYFGEMHFIERQFIKCPECKSQTTLRYFVDGTETQQSILMKGLKI